MKRQVSALSILCLVRIQPKARNLLIEKNLVPFKLPQLSSSQSGERRYRVNAGPIRMDRRHDPGEFFDGEASCFLFGNGKRLHDFERIP
ncbi:MAG: hypothetical protein MI807_20285 [Verrucomicrobiales bacterium]|nr:hypothetical protein [Verrucomicrobiales bacterium]